MKAKDKKQQRDFVFQKIYELAHGGVVEGVRIQDLERETGLNEKELSGINSYFIQKNLLRLGSGYPPGVAPKTGAEYDAAWDKIEVRIHLTAEGVDYYESGFNSSSPHPTVNYHTTFQRETYGPVQLGGSHNTQGNNMPLEAPSQAMRADVRISGLEEADIRVLKAIGEEAINKGDRLHFIYTEALAKCPGLVEMSAEELDESLQILTESHYIELPTPRRGDIQVFQVTVLGFAQYARVFIEDYQSIFNSVISRIVNDGDTTNKAIAAALNQPLMVVNHILDTLQYDGKLSQAKTFNNEAGYEIFNVSPLLKRMLKRSNK